MPAEPVRDAAGREASLGELAGGEVMLVNLWATWCAPCMEEMPTLGALRRRFAGAGLKLIAVSVDSAADEAKARSELARLSGGSLEFFIEPSRAILFSARAAGMPVTLLYNREGNEIARLVGGADWASEEAAALIEAALAEDAPDGSGH